ncbi:MAG: hypothetical protein KDC27_06165 [Acidobacteria bacterium]|nr:hypothetical protein [Acidobacteriota bacterium]
MTRLAFILCAAALVAAPGLRAAEVSPQAAAIRKQIVDVERSIDRRFRSLQDAQPMTLLGAARGVYLDGYGAVFTLEVNLYPSAALSPFRQSYSEEEKRQLNVRKKQRLEDLEEKAREILVEESAKLTGLPDGEKIALAVSLFHFAWEDLTGLPRQLVMAAAQDLLAQARSGSLDVADMRRKFAPEYF